MRRIKRRNFVAKIPPNAKLVARPTRWGNPFSTGDRVKDVEAYKKWLGVQLKRNPGFLDELVGYDLVCYCPLRSPCHADVLLEIINKTYPTGGSQGSIDSYFTHVSDGTHGTRGGVKK